MRSLSTRLTKPSRPKLLRTSGRNKFHRNIINFWTCSTSNSPEYSPPHRSYVDPILLVECKEPPFGTLYGMSHDKQVALKQHFKENLSKGFARASSSLAGAPVLFIKRGDNSLRLCVDYRGINEMPWTNWYPVALIQEMLMILSKAKWFTKLVLGGLYNLVRMANPQELKTLSGSCFTHSNT